MDWATSCWVRPIWRALGAVHVDLHGGVGDLLVDVDVDGAGDGGDALQDAAGDLVVALAAALTTWTSMGAGRPKSRIWLVMLAGVKKKVAPGKDLGQLLAEGALVLGGLSLAGLEGDEDLAVRVGDGSGGAEGEIDAAVGETDVVEDELDLRPAG